MHGVRIEHWKSQWDRRRRELQLLLYWHNNGWPQLNNIHPPISETFASFHAVPSALEWEAPTFPGTKLRHGSRIVSKRFLIPIWVWAENWEVLTSSSSSVSHGHFWTFHPNLELLNTKPLWQLESMERRGYIRLKAPLCHCMNLWLPSWRMHAGPFLIPNDVVEIVPLKERQQK